MNELIINGMTSHFVQGLMILSLPPITKPQMRAQIDEVDGRNGDIITPLGFKAYDRDVEIGLAKHFDIDEVIDFFNASGEVIFSNEPDKFYTFDILNAIDFERLIRFRTAKVVFHCQPFKKSNVEFPLTFEDGLSTGIDVFNNGNYPSMPKMEIFGGGDIDVYINGTKVLDIELGSETSITIDAAQMEAYNGTTLKNRLVSGNYDNVVLQKGKNTLGFVGSNVTKVIVSNYSRWI